MSRRAFIHRTLWLQAILASTLSFILPRAAKAQIGPAILSLVVGSMFCCAILYVARKGGAGGVRLIRLWRHRIGARNPDGSKLWEKVCDNWVPLSNDPDKYFAAFSDQIAKTDLRLYIYRVEDITDDQFQAPPPGPYKTAGPVQPTDLWITVPSQ